MVAPVAPRRAPIGLSRFAVVVAVAALIPASAADPSRPRKPALADTVRANMYADADFAGATFILTDDLKLDDTVIFRRVIEKPPDGKARPDFSRLNDVVPEGPPPGGGRRPGGGRGPDGRRPPSGRPG